jgi:hypothetical protein
MAASANDHIHLDDVNPPVDEYHTALDGFRPAQQVFVTVDSALDGTKHVHRLVNEGVPVSYDGAAHVVLVDWDGFEALKAIHGKTVYFVDNWHDDADLASYTKTMVLLGVALQRAFTPTLGLVAVRIDLEEIT